MDFINFKIYQLILRRKNFWEIKKTLKEKGLCLDRLSLLNRIKKLN
jgi:hypothetical protein